MKKNDSPIGMTMHDKFIIISYHLSGYPLKNISDITGFSVDWLEAVIDALANNQEFKDHALKLNTPPYKESQEKEKTTPKKETKMENPIISTPELNAPQPIITDAPKRRGRPPGSKGKTPKTPTITTGPPKRRGRPPGSKNKSKTTS
jgi:hypothetical protein